MFGAACGSHALPFWGVWDGGKAAPRLGENHTEGSPRDLISFPFTQELLELSSRLRSLGFEP